MNTAKSCLSWATAAVLLGACSSTPIAPPVASEKPMSAAAPQASVTAPASVSPAAQGRAPVATVALPSYPDPRNDLSAGRSFYFDFDQADLKKEFEPLIARHGNFLTANPKVAIRVEGNADERGSAEYNLALGQRRAQAVVSALKVIGVKDAQMEAISWGSEKPKALGHDESAWAQNRRADLQYPSK